MLCRSRERGERARDALRAAAPAGSLHLHLCDMSSLADVRRFAEEFKNGNGDGGSPRKLDVLVNNAGLMKHTRVDTPDGFELNFAVNVLGTYVLTEMLMPCLEAAGSARVVTVSSGGMLLSGRESLQEGTCYGDDLVTEPQEEGEPTRIDGQVAYSRNKRCQVALTEHWAVAHAGTGVRFFAMHPGWASTEGLKSSMPEFHTTFSSSLRTPEEGADTIVWLSVAEEVEKETNGDFFLDRASQPRHLWLAGTKYASEDLSGLVTRLSLIATQKAGIEIKACESSNKLPSSEGTGRGR